MGSVKGTEIVRRLSVDRELEDYVVWTVWYLKPHTNDAYPSIAPSDFDFGSLASAAAASLKMSHESFDAANPFDQGALTNFWVWRELDKDAADHWLRAKVDAGHWSLVDILGTLTSVMTEIGSNPPVTRLGDFDIRAADDIFGLSSIFGELSDVLDGTSSSAGRAFDTPATPNNRIQKALYQLKLARDERRRGESRAPNGGPDTNSTTSQ
jgi:hypothetical protein